MANKILVIGGNGVVGHFVTRQLVGQGERPFVLSRSGDTALIADVKDRVETVKGDITDGPGLTAIVKQLGITHVIHLGTILPAEIDSNPAKGTRVNVEGAANVLEAAHVNGVKRVIMASSKAVYGAATGPYGPPGYKGMTEDLRPVPYNVYGITKLAAEQLASWYRKHRGLEVTSLRFGATIGPGKISRHGGNFSRYSVMIEAPMAGKPVRIESGGDGVCDALYNDDVARGIVLALQSPTINTTCTTSPPAPASRSSSSPPR